VVAGPVLDGGLHAIGLFRLRRNAGADQGIRR
jgi:hypothetical protein